MTNNELQAYQSAAWATAIYPDKGAGTSIYPYLKLCGEVGEVAEMFGKRMRDGVTDEAAWRLGLLKELGDVLWYCAAIATEQGLRLRPDEWYVDTIDHISIQLCVSAAGKDYSKVAGIVGEIAHQHHSTLAEVAALNLAKLAKRQATGTLRGSGSDREEHVSCDADDEPGAEDYTRLLAECQTQEEYSLRMSHLVRENTRQRLNETDGE